MPLVTLPATAPLEEMTKVMRRDGGIIISGFLQPEDLASLNADAQPFFDRLKATPKGKNLLNEMGPDFHASHTTHLRGMLGKLPSHTSKVVKHPVWNHIMHETLKTKSETYVGDHLLVTETTHILSLAVGFNVAPGANAQVLHRDQSIHSVQAEENSLYTTDVGCLVAGTRSTSRNGATMVVPGSHLWPRTRIPKPEEAVPAVMEPGSAMFWMGSLYHGAGANVCGPEEADRIRILYGYFGCGDYLRAEECQQLVCPPEVARTLEPEVLRRCGWAKGKGGCGFVEAVDPILSLDLVHKEEGAPKEEPSLMMGAGGFQMK